MSTGTVKWFNNAKGYGFILEDDGHEDLFAHFSSIQMDGYKTLKAGQIVEFDTVAADKGFHAVNIRAVVTENTETLPETPDANTSKIEESIEHNNQVEHV